MRYHLEGDVEGVTLGNTDIISDGKASTGMRLATGKHGVKSGLRALILNPITPRTLPP